MSPSDEPQNSPADESEPVDASTKSRKRKGRGAARVFDSLTGELLEDVEGKGPYLPAEHRDERTNIPPGFQIRRLLLVGAKLPEAELRFSPGLNVVVGPSNAGKSFAFYLLDYVLGATKLKKMPKEAKPYSQVVVEIESAGGETFTITRNLDSSSFRWHDVPFDEIGKPGVRFRLLARKAAEGKLGSVSAQYLTLSKLAGLRLRENTDNKTHELSFREVLKLCRVDETRIVTDGSSICGANPNANTSEKSLLDLMLSGRDASKLVASENTGVRRSRLVAQADLLDEILDEGRTAVASKGNQEVTTETPRPDAAELERQRLALTEVIVQLEADLSVNAAIVDNIRLRTSTLMATMLEARSRLLVVRELLGRFELLRQSYQSDLDRLALIEVGSDLLQQLPEVSCPTCGQPMVPGHLHLGEPGEGVTTTSAPTIGEGIRRACAAEASAIATLLRDLDKAVAELSEEEIGLRSRVRDGTREMESYDRQLAEELRPRMTEGTARLRQSVASRESVLRQQADLQHRASLVDRRYELERELSRLGTRPQAVENVVEDVGTEGLGEQMRTLLDAWMGDVGSVRFDRETMDFVIGGEPRADQGKGVRAIWFAAFVIGLMRLCRSEQRPHPGFVILDSPLTTFRGGPRLGRGPEDVSEDVEQAFFRHLASTSKSLGALEQIIIFDNKEPPMSVGKEANVIRFTGRSGGAREGFVPRPESAT